MKPFKHIHSSSRYDRSNESLEAAVRKYVDDAPLVTLTEVDFEFRERVLRRVATDVNFGVLTGDESHADDCAILYSKERFELLYSESFQSATQAYYRSDGVKRDLPYSTIGVFKDLVTERVFVVAVGHFASSVEAELSRGNKVYRRAIQWRQSAFATKKRVNRLAKKFKASARLIVADWNVDFKNVWVRRMVKAIAPSYTLTWENVKVKGGTHGNRIIDATIIRGKLEVKGSAKLYEDDPSSDHRPYIETLSWR